MPFDRESLLRAAKAAAERARVKRPSGIEGLILDLHRGELGEFVTIESSALPPVPIVSESTVGVAIAVPGPDSTWIPWGRVIWSWPDGRVLSKERLSSDLVRSVAVAGAPAAFAQSCAKAEAHLAGAPNAAEELLGLYREILGDEGVELLERVFEEASDVWSGT